MTAGHKTSRNTRSRDSILMKLFVIWMNEKYVMKGGAIFMKIRCSRVSGQVTFQNSMDEIRAR